MPGKEIKGRSKRANYRHGGRTGFKDGGPPGRTYPSTKWKEPKTGLTREQVEDLHQQIKDYKKTPKFKSRTPIGKKKLPSYKKGGKV